MASSELLGLRRLSRLSPEELRRKFTQAGRFHGGLRAALLGGVGGALLSDPDDSESYAANTLGGALLAGAAGAGLGHLHGAHLSKNPIKRMTADDGTVLHYLRSPGALGDELIHAKFKTPRPTYNPTSGKVEPVSSYSPSTGSDLLASLMDAGAVPLAYRR